MDSLKRQNQSELNKLTLVYVSIIGATLIDTYSTESSFDLNGFAASALLLTAATLGVNLFLELMPRHLKEVLVFMKLKNRLPSYRAFRQQNLKDPRINKTGLAEALGEAPKSEAQNFTKWFEFYKLYGSEAASQEAHRKFLLYREMTIQAYLFLVIALNVSFFVKLNLLIIFSLTIFFIMNILFFSFAARVAARKLVLEVIIEASHKASPQAKAL